ncbi:MAG: hypothetical protein BWY09_01024 [Candidatus Hydrogenedentes bacterium ADurb.Bin179]|nr:MAG: hypothetical protein BWY09_01024 [Candidatus Hydrogenedentes bacterium ADurb.Bin179]
MQVLLAEGDALLKYTAALVVEAPGGGFIMGENNIHPPVFIDIFHGDRMGITGISRKDYRLLKTAIPLVSIKTVALIGIALDNVRISVTVQIPQSDILRIVTMGAQGNTSAEGAVPPAEIQQVDLAVIGNNDVQMPVIIEVAHRDRTRIITRLIQNTPVPGKTGRLPSCFLKSLHQGVFAYAPFRGSTVRVHPHGIRKMFLVGQSGGCNGYTICHKKGNDRKECNTSGYCAFNH